MTIPSLMQVKHTCTLLYSTQFNNNTICLVTSMAFYTHTSVQNLYHGIVNSGSLRFSGTADMAFKSRGEEESSCTDCFTNNTVVCGQYYSVNAISFGLVVGNWSAIHDVYLDHKEYFVQLVAWLCGERSFEMKTKPVRMTLKAIKQGRNDIQYFCTIPPDLVLYQILECISNHVFGFCLHRMYFRFRRWCFPYTQLCTQD